MTKLPAIAAPAGLEAAHLQIADDEYVILSYPLPEWSLPASLSAAERAVVARLLQGDSNEQVARGRGTSVRTVANQVASVFAKLRINSRAQLAKLCGVEPQRPR